MAEVDFVIVADYVRMDDGVLHIVGGGIDRISAATVPTAQNLGLGLRLLFTRNECERPHELEIVFQDEDGAHLVEARLTLVPKIPPGFPAGFLVPFTVNANLGVALPRYGHYSFEILLDGQSKKSIPILVAPLS